MMAGGVKVTDVSNKSIPLVEGAQAIDDQWGDIKTQDRRTCPRLLPLHRDDM